jgi:hypothetical protein
MSIWVISRWRSWVSRLQKHRSCASSDVADLEIEIVQELVDRLRGVDQAVCAANDAIAELDWWA